MIRVTVMDNEKRQLPEEPDSDDQCTEKSLAEPCGENTSELAGEPLSGETDSPVDVGAPPVHNSDDPGVQKVRGDLAVSPSDSAESDVPRISSRAEIKAVLEALLFATTEPLSTARLAKIIVGASLEEIRAALLELQMEYDSLPRGLQIVEVAGGFQMATRPHLAPWIFRLKPSKRRNPLSQATLETLAIIAYKQPITRAEIEAIRGVDSTATIHTLLDLGLVEVGGKREIPGRPQLYVTTELFLKTFGLKSLGDLPSIHELRRLYSSEGRVEQKMQATSPLPVTPARNDELDAKQEDRTFNTEAPAAERPSPENCNGAANDRQVEPPHEE